MKRSVRRWLWVVVVLAVATGVAYGGWRLARAWRYRTALVEIREQVQAGRHGVAARNLAAVLAWEPGSDEAAYLLGLCEKARGRTEAADEAWVRVPLGSRFAPPAIAGRAAMQVDANPFITTNICTGNACWHAHENYAYPPSAHVTVHPDTWKWGPSERYAWKEHEGRGYWNGDRWTEF